MIERRVRARLAGARRRESRTPRTAPAGAGARSSATAPSRVRSRLRIEVLEDVAAFFVADLVRQHRLYLRLVERFQQRVEQHDALGAAESGEVGIAVAANGGCRPSPAPTCTRNSQARSASATRRCFSVPSAERLELVEQRRDDRLVQVVHQQLEGGHETERPDPPAFAPLSAMNQNRPSSSGTPRIRVSSPGSSVDRGRKVRHGHAVEAEASLRSRTGRTGAAPG